MSSCHDWDSGFVKVYFFYDDNLDITSFGIERRSEFLSGVTPFSR